MAEVAESGIVVPVTALDPVVGPWRAEWDPAARIGVPAHVTLLYPFLPPPVPSSAVAALVSLCASVAAWEVSYGGFAEFPGGVLYLPPVPAAPFVALTEALMAAWPECPPYGGRFDTVVPHLTVCDGAPAAVVALAAATVAPSLPLSAVASEAWLMEQAEPGGTYALTARLPFSG